MRRYSSKNGLHSLTELNITPMLDLVFVLLIIFMITTPLIENSMDLVVPKSSTAAGAANPSQTFNISIDKNNILKINKNYFRYSCTSAHKRYYGVHLSLLFWLGYN